MGRRNDDLVGAARGDSMVVNETGDSGDTEVVVTGVNGMPDGMHGERERVVGFHRRDEDRIGNCAGKCHGHRSRRQRRG